MDRRYSLNDGLELWTSPESPERSLGGESSNIWGLLLNIVLYTIASLQLWVSWQFEWFHATAFSILCFLTRRRSRNHFERQRTAVVVMGAGEGEYYTLPRRRLYIQQ